MPFRSIRQRTYLQINEPKVYNKWKKEYGTKIIEVKGTQKNRGYTKKI